jgi:NitT/TauT family transport system substrate-binding protein
MMFQKSKHIAVIAATTAVLSAVALSGCSASSTTSSGTAKLTKASLLTGYVYGPEYVGFFAARDLGYYKDAGLDVTINAGQGSSSNAQLLASGKVDFAEVDGTTMIETVAKGAPLKMIAGLQEISGGGIAVLPSIKTPSDLSGKTFTGTAYDFATRLYPVFTKKLGITNSPTVNVNAASIPQIFAAGQAQAMTANAWAEVPEMKAEGVKFNYFAFADYGLNTLGPGIVVNTSMLKNHLKEAKAFVQATMRGWKWVYSHKAQAVDLIVKDVPAIKRNVATANFETLQNYSYTPATKNKPLGCLAESDWNQTISIVKNAGLVTGNVPTPSQLYTNLVEGC